MFVPFPDEQKHWELLWHAEIFQQFQIPTACRGTNRRQAEHPLREHHSVGQAPLVRSLSVCCIAGHAHLPWHAHSTVCILAKEWDVPAETYPETNQLNGSSEFSRWEDPAHCTACLGKKTCLSKGRSICRLPFHKPILSWFIAWCKQVMTWNVAKVIRLKRDEKHALQSRHWLYSCCICPQIPTLLYLHQAVFQHGPVTSTYASHKLPLPSHTLWPRESRCIPLDLRNALNPKKRKGIVWYGSAQDIRTSLPALLIPSCTISNWVSNFM